MDLEKVIVWFNANKLSLNVEKTFFLFFGNNNNEIYVQIHLSGISIKRVKEIKFLGVIIDEQVNWKSHVKHIQAKLARSKALLHKAKFVLDYRSLRILYCAYLTYCAEVWENNYTTTIHPFISLIRCNEKANNSVFPSNIRGSSEKCYYS